MKNSTSWQSTTLTLLLILGLIPLALFIYWTTLALKVGAYQGLFGFIPGVLFLITDVMLLVNKSRCLKLGKVVYLLGTLILLIMGVVFAYGGKSSTDEKNVTVLYGMSGMAFVVLFYPLAIYFLLRHELKEQDVRENAAVGAPEQRKS